MEKSFKMAEETRKKECSYRNNLVLTIDENERIIKFNKESEDLSGFAKTEVLNRKLIGFLIPLHYENQLINILNISRQNKIVDNIKLPLLTKNGHEIMISWSSFPVKNETGKIGDINLVGNLIKSWIDDNESIIERKTDSEKRNVILKNAPDHKNTNKVLNQLQKINDELIKKNNILEKNLKKLKKRKNYDDNIEEKSNHKSGHIVNKTLYSFSELFGGKKRKQEFETMMHELEEREKLLNNRESELLKEKRKINEQIIDFKKWRNRLELLETDIENRLKQLVNQENVLLNNITGDSNISFGEKINEDIKQSYDIFEKIPDSAVIIHRGIIKKVNDTFSDLIGYNTNEIINKSLFDFISSEGFYDVEKYYLDRLKGEDVSFYNTIFLTKNNNKIPVEINAKPTIFDGDKAEIAIIKKIKK